MRCRLVLLLLISFQLTIIAQTNPIKIDGKITQSEWNGAKEIELVGGKFVKYKSYNDFLYIAIKGAKGGFSSIGIAYDDTVKILHSSTRLITATYVKTNSSWKLVQEFTALKNSKRDVPVSEKEQLNEFRWRSNLVSEGDPSETELKISRSLFHNKPIKASFVFLQFMANPKYAFAPKDLNDGSLNAEMVGGGKVDKLSFNIDQWLDINLNE